MTWEEFTEVWEKVSSPAATSENPGRRISLPHRLKVNGEKFGEIKSVFVVYDYPDLIPYDMIVRIDFEDGSAAFAGRYEWLGTLELLDF